MGRAIIDFDFRASCPQARAEAVVAAHVLRQTLAQHREDVAGHIEPGYLEVLVADLITLRHALLALQMGALDWEAPTG